MRLPDFLIVGAQKAGTTTLFFDLVTQPNVYEPTIKEPASLVGDKILTEAGLREYAALFESARADQLVCEASTQYTKTPQLSGAVDRARTVFGERFPSLRVIYIVREPISRIRSHHHHEYTGGSVGPDINRAVREHAMFVDWTRYATQITPWIDALGRDRVLLVQFERYMSARREGAAEVARFLGFEADTSRIDPDRAENASANKPTHTALTSAMTGNALYRRVVRPFLPYRLRDRLRRRLMAQAPPRPDPPTPETVAWLRERLGDEPERIGRLMGLEGSPWPRPEGAVAGAGGSAGAPATA